MKCAEETELSEMRGARKKQNGVTTARSARKKQIGVKCAEETERSDTQQVKMWGGYSVCMPI